MNKIAKSRHRIFAFLFDWAIVYGFSLLLAAKVIIIAIRLIVNNTDYDIISLTINALLTGGIILIFICFYFLVLPVFLKGQTLGKKFFRIKVIKCDGSNVDFPTLFLREVIGKVLVDFVSVGISVIATSVVMSNSKNHQGFHDVLASTIVVDVE